MDTSLVCSRVPASRRHTETCTRMSYLKHLRGLASGQHYPADQLMNLDPIDQRPVEMILDLPRLAADCPGLGWLHPERHSLWRYGALLALDSANTRDREHIIDLGEGYTPELPWPDHPLAQHGNFRLALKDEGSHHPGFGGNPTLSFKDRGMAMVVSQARRFGLRKLVVPTQGNAGDSLAHYALAAGLDAAVIMPDDTPMPIMGKVAALAHRHPGIRLELVEGTIREAGERMREHYLPQGYFNVATFQEPGWRIEGKKTLGLELAEPDSLDQPWRLPDVIVYPTGGGTGVLGIWKAFDELEQLGVIDDHRPRMICIQSEATTPLVDAWNRGDEDTRAAEAGHTLAYGLNVPGGIGHFKVLDIVRRSGGLCLAISESDMAEALRSTWQQKHWWITPEGAACIAALPALMDQEMIQPGDRVVVINTGSGEKYLPEIRHLMR